MNALEKTAGLINAIAQQGQIQQVTLHEPQCWSLYLCEQKEIYAELIEASQQLVLTAKIAIPEDVNKQALYTLLLHYNNAWREPGFGFAALSEDESWFSLIYPVGVDLLTEPALTESLFEFSELIESYKHYVVELATNSQNKTEANSSSLEEINTIGSHYFSESHLLKI